MKRNIVAISLVLLAFCACSSHSRSWWSLAVESGISEKVLDASSILCNLLANVLNTSNQRSFCTYNQLQLNYIAIGARSGIVACQEEFSDWRWNCTTFNGADLFGSFINNDTRETAVINSLLSAGGQRRLAKACKDEKLPSNCTCKSIGTNGYTDGTFYTYGCSYDIENSQRMIDSFLKQSVTDRSNSNIVANYNYAVGSNIVSQLREKCRCQGFSGSCSVKSCYSSSYDMETISTQIRRKYDNSLHVSIGANFTINPIISTSDFNSSIKTYLIYTNGSPTFCDNVPSKGVLGTFGRPCNASSNSVDSCSVICCGRGYNTKVEQKPKECCQFVFCCRVECTSCGHEEVITYTCK